MHDRCVLIIKREALTRLEISTRLLDQIRVLVTEQRSEMSRLMQNGLASVPVSEVRRLILTDGESNSERSENISTTLEESAKLPKMLELLNEVSIASHWLRR